VLAYALGRRAWLELTDWPPPEGEPLDLPLAGGGAIEVDPAQLPPTLGGRALLVSFPGTGFGVRDQRPLAARDDVLTLHAQAPPGMRTLLAGPVSARLPVAADGEGRCDWAATLCLVGSDGRLDNLCEGIARCDATAAEVAIELGDVCVELAPGARLALLVAGGSFPRWEGVSRAGRQRVMPGGALRVRVSPPRSTSG
jgi:uncharacterized protein